MKAFIYVGGDINPDMITEHPKGDDITVAADSGYENAKRLGERVDLFVGDMDSYGGEIDEKVQTVRLKPEKDVTDTQAAFELAVERGADGAVKVTGHTCPRGEAYAIAELTNPTRMVTGLVRVAGTRRPLPVKTRTAIPKGKIAEVTNLLANTTVIAPKHIGDVIIPDVCGTGVSIVATKNVPVR